MKLLGVIVALALALAVQASLGLLWPGAGRYLDVMLVPVVWYGLAGSQRTAMLVGCTAGLLYDAWFQIGVFGLNGFKKTFLGWALGGLGSRFDLNRSSGWLAAGVLMSLTDGVMDVVLRRLLDLEQAMPAVGELLLRALFSGILVAVTFGLASRARSRREMRRLA